MEKYLVLVNDKKIEVENLDKVIDLCRLFPREVVYILHLINNEVIGAVDPQVLENINQKERLKDEKN